MFNSIKKVTFIKEFYPKHFLPEGVYCTDCVESALRDHSQKELDNLIQHAFNIDLNHSNQKTILVDDKYTMHILALKEIFSETIVVLISDVNQLFEIKEYLTRKKLQSKKNEWLTVLTLVCYGKPMQVPTPRTWEEVAVYFKKNPDKCFFLCPRKEKKIYFLKFKVKHELSKIVVLGSDQVDIKGSIGEGAYKLVYFCLDKQGCLYALEILGNEKKRFPDNINFEEKLMRQLNGPVLITHYHDVQFNLRYRLLDYLGINLYEFRKSGLLTAKKKLYILNHLLLKLLALHTQKDLVYRDLRLENILYNPDNIDHPVSLVDYNLSEPLNSRAMLSGDDVFLAAQAMKEDSSPFLDTFAFKRLCYQQLGRYYLKRSIWHAQVVFSHNAVDKIALTLDEQGYNHGVILVNESHQPLRWFFYLFAQGIVNNKLKGEITEGKDKILFSFLNRIIEKEQLNYDIELNEVLKSQLKQSPIIDSRHTRTFVNKHQIIDNWIIKDSLMDEDEVTIYGLTTLMQRIEELGAPETGLDSSSGRYYALPDMHCPLVAVLACFILVEQFWGHNRSELLAEVPGIFCSGKTVDWNLKYFLDRPHCTQAIIQLYQKKCNDVVKYRSLLSNNS